jgi:uncharacterized protein YjbJ (UPF0337 family)
VAVWSHNQTPDIAVPCAAEEDEAMTNHDTSDQTRNRIANTVVGKAKEFAGAVSGNDELTEEGRLRQEEARAEREATSRDAHADAREAQARQEREQAVEQGQRAKRQAEEEAARDKLDIVTEQGVIR